MVVVYRCKQCGEVLHVYWVGKESFGLPTPEELKIRVTRTCPRCGRELGKPGVWDVEIRYVGGRNKSPFLRKR